MFTLREIALECRSRLVVALYVMHVSVVIEIPIFLRTRLILLVILKQLSQFGGRWWS